MSTETQITKGWVDSMKAAGAIVVPYVASRRQPAGYPDRIIHHATWTGWIELKGYRTPVETRQRMRIDSLNARRPASAFVFRFTHDATPAAWAGWIESSRGHRSWRDPIDSAGQLLMCLERLVPLLSEG